MVEEENQHHGQSHSQSLNVNVYCTQLLVQHAPPLVAALVTYYLTHCKVFFPT